MVHFLFLKWGGKSILCAMLLFPNRYSKNNVALSAYFSNFSFTKNVQDTTTYVVLSRHPELIILSIIFVFPEKKTYFGTRIVENSVQIVSF